MKLFKIAAAALAFAAVPSAALAEEKADDAKWSLSIAGGTTTLENRGDQPFLSVGLTRNFGKSYARVSASHISTRDGQGLVGAVPAKTDQLTLGGGTSFGAFSLDGTVSFGRRTFGAEAFRRRNGQSIGVTSHGRTAGAGLSLTYDAALGRHWFVSPFVSVDYSRVDIARAVTIPTLGLVTRKEKEEGVTGTVGASAQYLFGAGSAHAIGPYAAFAASSNTTAYGRATSPVAAARLTGARDVPGAKDSWFEYGATASFRIAKPVRLDLSFVRTAGFIGPESSSGSIGLRFAF